MAVTTVDELRSYNLFHGEAHAGWCPNVSLCSGECTTTATYPTADGQQITVTVTLPFDAVWPKLTYTLPDGTMRDTVDPARFTLKGWEAFNRQVRRWSEGTSIPSPVHRAKRPAVTA